MTSLMSLLPIEPERETVVRSRFSPAQKLGARAERPRVCTAFFTLYCTPTMTPTATQSLPWPQSLRSTHTVCIQLCKCTDSSRADPHQTYYIYDSRRTVQLYPEESCDVSEVWQVPKPFAPPQCGCVGLKREGG